VIRDLETLKLIADATRAAILELLAEPRSVTQLAEALGVPRTRLYHHIDLLVARSVIEQVDERRVGALRERFYALTAKTFRPSPRLLQSGDVNERADALTTLILDTTKADLRRSLVSGEAEPDDGGRKRLGAGRSIAFLTPERAAQLIGELEDVVARFDDAHEDAPNARPFAFVWALYPSSRRVG
jgi:DNA-binding transcriptional ArsR family regulator